MGFVSKAIGKVVGGITGANQAADAASNAANVQAQASQAGIAEQRRQFDELTRLMSPYVDAGAAALPGLSPYASVGPEALAQQRALAGLGTPEEQQAAVQAVENDPQFQALARQGVDAILQNASATGGLRGGNTQAALAQFRPGLLDQYIQEKYARLGGLTNLGASTTQNIASLGQSSAAGQGAAGLQSADSISNLLSNSGSAQAGGIIAQGNKQRQAFGDLLNIGGIVSGF